MPYSPLEQRRIALAARGDFLLVRAARNNALATHYRRVVNELDLYRRETLVRGSENIPVSTREHEAIVHALAKGDERLAERLLTEHVLHSRERLHGALAKPSRMMTWASPNTNAPSVPTRVGTHISALAPLCDIRDSTCTKVPRTPRVP